MPVAAVLTNPDWGVTQADVNALTQRTIPTFQHIRDGMATDSRYSAWAGTIDQMISQTTHLAQIVTDYIQIQGT